MNIFENTLERFVRTARARSPWLFYLNTDGCNGSDIEMVAYLTPRYNLEQLGIRLEGIPRHADVLSIPGQ